jgi:ligand-binding sensor domain-containing protein/signal transduction histidine kinase
VIYFGAKIFHVQRKRLSSAAFSAFAPACHYIRVACVLLAVVFIPPLRASENRFIVDRWEAKEGGLPQNSVIAMTQTSDGYLWLGTQQGLARFDGVHFKTFNDGNTPGLNSTTITKLFGDSHGNLWIRTQSPGVLMVDKQGNLKRINFGQDSAESQLLDICEDQGGVVWLALSNLRLYSYSDGQVGVLVTNCWKVISDNAGNTWGVTTLLNIFSFRTVPGSQPIAVDPGGYSYVGPVDFLLGSKNGGYTRFANGHIEKWLSNRVDAASIPYPWGTSRVGVNAACEDLDGNLIVGTSGDGVFWFDAKGDSQHLSSNIGRLSHNTILSLLVDREGDLWVGTDGGGLNRIRRQVFDVAESGRIVQSVSQDREGRLWFASGGEVITLKNDQREVYKPGIEVRAVFVDTNNDIWAGANGGILRMRETNFISTPAPFFSGQFIAIYQDRNKKLWAGAQNGLTHWSGSNWLSFPIPDPSPALSVHAIVDDAEGSLWVGTEGGGLKRFREGRWDFFTRTNGLPSNNVSSLYLDHEGALWVGTTGGLARFFHGQWTTYSKSQGMITDGVAYIIEDDQGNLWLGSTAGLMCVQKTELSDIAAEKAKTALFRSFGEADGLPSSECSFGFQPAACRASDGKLYFPTILGVASVNPASLKLNTNAPPVIIESILLNGVLQNPDTIHSPPPTKLTVPAGAERLEIGFTSLNLAAPLKGRFQYKLEGFDSTWTEKSGDVRFASYTRLPPDNYTFHVRACNEDGKWSDSDAVLAIKVLPPFWRTWWFLTATTICLLWIIAGSVYYVSTQRLHRQLESLRQQEALEKERARIARDLHDQLGANLTQVALLSEMAEADKELPEEVEAHAKQISQTARETTHALDEIVWTVNPSNDTLDGLINYVCKYAQEYLAMADLRYRLEVPSQLPNTPISPELRHNVFLAAKESVNNVVKHSRATSAWLRLHLEPHQFTLEIEDNGRGIAPADEKKGRSGLRNMRKRMEDIGGKFEMTAGAEGGAKVRLTAPLNSK